jgi:hypothetical protein
MSSLYSSLRFRSERLGLSISAAEKYFNLFDRVPTIDSGSTEGQELVRKIIEQLFSFHRSFLSHLFY